MKTDGLLKVISRGRFLLFIYLFIFWMGFHLFVVLFLFGFNNCFILCLNVIYFGTMKN